MYNTALYWYQARTAYTQYTESDKALSNFLKQPVWRTNKTESVRKYALGTSLPLR